MRVLERALGSEDKALFVNRFHLFRWWSATAKTGPRSAFRTFSLPVDHAKPRARSRERPRVTLPTRVSKFGNSWHFVTGMGGSHSEPRSRPRPLAEGSPDFPRRVRPS